MARTYRPSFVREWREFRGLTLKQLGSRINLDHSNLSRMERGRAPYNQEHIEKIAQELNTDPISLLARNPRDPEGIWSLWDRLSPAQRRLAIALIQTLIDI
jgi:transcriptional regulator with XRE-family HTH domain